MRIGKGYDIHRFQDGGELIIYAPHIDSFSYTHGHIIERIGYHVAQYYASNLDRFGDIPRAVMAVGAYITGAGTYRGGVEARRIQVTVASRIPRERCERVGLGYADPRTIDPAGWAGRKEEGTLVVERAGETLFRYSRPAGAGEKDTT